MMAIDFKKLGKSVNRRLRAGKRARAYLSEVEAWHDRRKARGRAHQGPIVLVTGGRDYRDEDMVNAVLNMVDRVEKIALLIEGGANGADRLCSNWTVKNDTLSLRVEADWRGEGKRAGYTRNKKMAQIGPHLCIAFPGGKGTQNMIDIAKQFHIPVIQILGGK